MVQGVPEILVVITISSIPDLLIACLYSLLTLASVEDINLVPTETPLAPSAKQERTPPPVAIPPAAITGISGKIFINAGTKTCRGFGPAWPPAPCPTAINPSQPSSAHFFACTKLVTSQKTFPP